MKEFLTEHKIKLEGEIVKIGRKYFLADKEILQFTKKITRQAEYIGTYLGIDKKSFSPSPALIEIASKQVKNQVIVNDKAEWMFLCGKDVFFENAKGTTKGTVFVMNEKNENLGMGYWTNKKGKKILKNSLDKGIYLRN